MEALERKNMPRETAVSPSLPRLLKELFARLNRSGIRYCVLRDYEDLPERIGNDIDLLVDPGGRKRFRECLVGAAQATGWRLVKSPARFHFCSYWLASDQDYSVVHLDVWSLLNWKGICFAPNDSILNRRKGFRGFYIPDSDIEVGSYVIKDLIQNGAVKDKYKTRIRKYCRNHSDGIQEFLQWSLGRALAAWLTEKACQGAWEEIDARAWAVRRTAVWQAFLRNPFGPLIDFTGFLWGHFQALLKRPSGIFLVLIGPDGSGKSTVADKLQSLWKGSHYYHGRFGLLPELKVFKNLFLRLAGQTPPEPPAPGTYAAHNAPLHSRARTLVYLAYYSLDFLLGHWIVRRIRSRGDLIIFDRYFYDWFIQAYYGRMPRWILPLLKAFLPRPDLVVYLENRPEMIHQRKPELTVAQIEQQRHKCRRLVQGLHDAMTVSTVQTPEKVADEIGRRMIDVMAGRSKYENS